MKQHLLTISRGLTFSCAFLALLLVPAAYADSGFYLGGSIGKAGIETDIDDDGIDDADSAYKVFAGYIIDLPVVDFAVEAGYVDLGAPSATILGERAEIDISALTAIGVVGLDFGVVGGFVKAGLVAWDADLSLGAFNDSESGSDPAYGVGLRFTLSSIEIRAEYEKFDIEDTDNADMVSVGVVWRF
jgi:hypothetical protein